MNLRDRRVVLVLFFVLAFLFTWLRWVPEAAAARGWIAFRAPFGLELLGGYGPLLAAVLTAALTGGRVALKDLGARLVRWRAAPRWYLVVFALPLLIQALGLLFFHLVSGQPLALADDRLPVSELLIFLPMFVLGFDGLGEEAGWRGFALPRLLGSQSALAASLILGLLWGLWHLPYAQTPGSALANTPLYLLLANTVGLAILHTWIFTHNGGSAFMAILFHAWNNLLATAAGSWLERASDPRMQAAGLAGLWLTVVIVVLFFPPFQLARRLRPDQPRMDPTSAD